MAINKNAYLRYQVLDKCFRNTGRMYFFEDLLNECNEALLEFDPQSAGIQRRQLFEDIRFMESQSGFNIELNKHRQGRRTYYRYADPSFSITNQDLNHSEIEQLKSALQVLSRLSGTPQFNWVNEMIPLLETRFGLIEQKQEIICFDSNLDLKGLEFITPLFNAIINQRVLRISYKDFKSPAPYEVLFHPHYLKQFNGRWFVFGLNQALQLTTWNMALDRIQHLSETDWEYQPTTINWSDYFYDLVGVTRKKDTELQEIKLRFSHEAANYVITKPLHPSQKIEVDQAGLYVRIQVYPNVELERLILSFGQQVSVIAPAEFKAQIKQRLEQAYQHYQ